MNARRLRSIYLLGIALNAVALAYAVRDGAAPFAVAFGLVLLYLGVRYRMVATGEDESANRE